jgi:cob(I)alamin adenosyltransferase
MFCFTGLITLKYGIPDRRGNSSCIQAHELFVILESMIEFDKITTRGGDFGETSIADGSRRPKDDLLIDVLGEVDEFHALLGLLKAALRTNGEQDEIDWMERGLLRLGGMIAVPPSHPTWEKLDVIGNSDIEKLEQWQKEMMEKVNLPPLFITYGGSESGARADVARAVCRRVERRLVRLIRERGMTDLAAGQRFLNRLSDWLFVKARQLDAAEA